MESHGKQDVGADWKLGDGLWTAGHFSRHCRVAKWAPTHTALSIFNLSAMDRAAWGTENQLFASFSCFGWGPAIRSHSVCLAMCRITGRWAKKGALLAGGN